MTIGRLAKAAGVNVETIRYYQRRGLLPEPPKPPGGQRRYPGAVLERLNFIRHAQQLGFSLEEVRQLLELAHGRANAAVRAMAERKRETIGTRLAELQKIHTRLEALIEESRRRGNGAECPIVAALKAGEPGL